MRSLYFVRQGVMEWRDVRTPGLRGSREAIVEILAASSCDIDRLVVTNPSPFSDPFAIGHNAIGRVMDIGEDVKSVAPGDLVAITWHISCGQCDQCANGLPAHCRATPPGASYGLPTKDHWGGLFDEVIRVPFADSMLFRLPSDVNPVELVAASDNLAVGYASIAPHIKSGSECVLILGSGINGLYVAAFARALGLIDVVYVDEDPDNLLLAAGLGCISAPILERAMGPFDIVVDAGCDPKPLRKRVLQVLQPEGVVECVGHMRDVTLDGWAWYGRGATFHCGVCSSGPHIDQVFRFVAAGTVLPSQLWSDLVPFDDDLPRAFVSHRRQLVAVRPDQQSIQTGLQ